MDLRDFDQQALLRAVKNKDSLFVKRVYGAMTASRSRRMAAKLAVKEMVVPYNCDGSAAAGVKRLFPEWNVRFVGTETTSTERFSAIRYLVYEQMMRQDKWLGDSVICFDSALDVHAAKCRDFVHVVKTMATVIHEAENLIEHRRLGILARGDTPGAMVARQMLESGSGVNGSWSNAAQHGVRQGDTLVFDLTRTPTCLMQIALEMLARNSDRAKIMFPFSNEFFLRERGDLPCGLGEFVVDVKSSTLTCVLEEDPSQSFILDYEAIYQMVAVSVFKVESTVFFCERVSHHAGFMICKVTRVDTDVVGETSVFHRVWDEVAVPMVELGYWSYDSDRGTPQDRSAWVWVKTKGPKSIYDKLYAKANDIVEGKYSLEALMRLMRDFNNRVVGAGMTFDLVEHFKDPMQEAEFATAVYIQAMSSRVDHAAAVKEGMANVVRERDMRGATLASLWAMAVAAMGTKATDMAAIGVESILTCLLGKYSDGRGDLVEVQEILPYTEYTSVVVAADIGNLTDLVWGRAFNQHLYGGVAARRMYELRGGKSVETLLNSVLGRARARGVGGKKLRDTKRLVGGLSTVGLSGQKVVFGNDGVIPVEVAKVVVVPPAGELEGQQKSLAERMVTASCKVSSDLITAVRVGHVESGESVREVCGFVRSVDPVADMQDFWGAIDPDVLEGLGNDSAARVHDSDFTSTVFAPAMQLNLAKDVSVRPRWMRESRLLGPMGGPREQTMREVFNSVASRNFDAPQIAASVDPDRVAVAAWAALKKAFAVDNVDEILAEFRANPIIPSYEAEKEWIRNASSSTILKLMSCDLADEDMVLDVYSMMVKATNFKPKLDGTSQAKYSAVQVIVHHQKCVNAFFSPLFIEAAKRFDSILRHKVVANVRKDAKQVQERLTAALRANTVQSRCDGERNKLENDFSQYDKSQAEACMAIERQAYFDLGIPQDLLDVWMDSCYDGEVRSSAAGLRFWVAMQRKSGTATTALANMVINMSTVAYAYDLQSEDYQYAMFLGDDSLVKMNRDVNEGQAVGIMSDCFNLSAKCLITEYGYCCSAWILEVEGEVVVLSDAVKRSAVISGPMAMVDGLLEEKWISLGDLCHNYDDQVALEIQAFAIVERYRVAYGLALRLVEAVATVAKDYESYKTCYKRTCEVLNR